MKRARAKLTMKRNTKGGVAKFWKLIVPVSQLKIGDRFNWIPKAWFGECVLTHKQERIQFFNFVEGPVETFDLKYDTEGGTQHDATYGVWGTTKVRLSV